MSYASTASSEGSRTSTSRDAESATYLEGSRRVQQAVHKIQQHASDIRKETNRVLGASDTYTGNKQAVEDARQAAQAAAEEAKQQLDSFPIGGNSGEQNLRRLTQQKLTEGVACACKDIEEAWKAYEAADAERKKRAELAATVLTADGQEAHGLELGGAGSRMVMRQQLLEQEVPDAEVECHTAIVTEFTQQVTRVSQDIRGLQRAMVDLAEHTRAQGETIDNIETNMRRASDAMEDTNEQLQQASRGQTRNSKVICLMLVAAVIVAAIVILVVSQHHSR